MKKSNNNSSSSNSNSSSTNKNRKANNDVDSGIDFKVHRLRFADW